MKYADLFIRYGYQVESAEHRIYIYCQLPEKLTTQEEILHRDKVTANTIREMQSYIELLTEYRRNLAARYAELETMPYRLALKLERDPHYRGGVYYNVTITKTLADGTETDELREQFTGAERRKAFARFEELKKQRPGIEAVKDIEKRSWEK